MVAEAMAAAAITHNLIHTQHQHLILILIQHQS
jgi:hypothetical protein